MYIDINLLRKYEKEKKITIRPHPIYPLLVCNYTQEVTFSRDWDDITRMCRGLIVDIHGKVLARPFEKFFNIEEYSQQGFPPIPIGPFKVLDKLDGSLGILYGPPSFPIEISTRGSFTSAQAAAGTELLYRHMNSRGLLWGDFNPNLTYLFEIIHPASRVVVTYGEEKLVLLSVRKTETGKELPLEDFSELEFETPTQYDGIKDYTKIRELLSDDNKEGVVLLFDTGERVKIKFENYIRLHKLIVGVNELRVWEILSAGGKMDVYLKNCPEEFSKEILSMSDKIMNNYRAVEKTVDETFKNDFPTRKEAAAYFKTCPYPSMLFALLDGKPIDHLIWKHIRPKDSNVKIQGNAEEGE